MSQSSPLSSQDFSSKTHSVDELTKIFNTAVVSSRANANRDFSNELYNLVDSPSFEAILHGIRHLSNSQGVSERQAAEQIVKTFRKLDQVWTDYIFQEGVDRVQPANDSARNS